MRGGRLQTTMYSVLLNRLGNQTRREPLIKIYDRLVSTKYKICNRTTWNCWPNENLSSNFYRIRIAIMIRSRPRDHGINTEPSPQNTFNAGLYIFKIYLDPMFECTKYTYSRRCNCWPISFKFGTNIPVWKTSSNSLAKIILTPFSVRGRGLSLNFGFFAPQGVFGGNPLFAPKNIVEEVFF